MSGYRAWRDDGEARIIAKILLMHSQAFSRVDLSKICFVRSDDESDVPARILASKYPYNLSSSYEFIVQTFTPAWNGLAKAQRVDCISTLLSALQTQLDQAWSSVGESQATQRELGKPSRHLCLGESVQQYNSSAPVKVLPSK